MIPSVCPIVLLPTVTPLSVNMSGVKVLLTPWFEPVWRVNGRLMALEMLTRPVELNTGVSIPPATFFTRISATEQLRVLNWQLDILLLMAPWYDARQLSVSLNVTRQQVTQLLLSSARYTVQKLSPNIRLEINECFLPPGADPKKDVLLLKLHSLAPLWLDDFGAGTTGLSWLLSGMFETIKIDRYLLQELYVRAQGETYLSGLCQLAEEVDTQVITEGVYEHALLAFVRCCQANACQGWLWPGMTYDCLYTLPDFLPGGVIKVEF